MTIQFGRTGLGLVLCLTAAACSKEPRQKPQEIGIPAETTTAPAPDGGAAPALTPASREVEAPKRIGMQVITGSPEGFRVNSTILTGEKSAMLVDAQFTLADARKVADAIVATNKDLKTVYVTHSHPDHYFGFPAIKERFPNARLVALPATVSEIEKTWQAKVKQWQPQYKDAITSKPVVPEAITDTTLDLDGEKLELMGGQQGDDVNNSYVWVPSLRTAIVGDIAYDGVFPWTAETTPDTRKAWASTLDRLVAMKPDRVVPGHQKPEKSQDPSALNFTKEYLSTYDQELLVSKTPADLESKMKKRYPDAELDVIVKLGAEAAFAKTKATNPAQGSNDMSGSSIGTDNVGQRGATGQPAATATTGQPAAAATTGQPATTAAPSKAKDPATTPSPSTP
jgi:glyoxylase-like metal-dependent hydrolase (beta-lactamase superfamily II)